MTTTTEQEHTVMTGGTVIDMQDWIAARDHRRLEQLLANNPEAQLIYEAATKAMSQHSTSRLAAINRAQGA